jgi:NDP-sugar pyrophosphorylase family protein
LKIEQLLGDGSDFGVHLKYTTEPQPMGTAGAYKFAAEYINEPTVVFNGDVLTNLDLKRVIDEHKQRDATATVVLTPVDDPSSFGVVETDRDGRVLRFIEKPAPGEAPSNNINAGTYILEPGVLDLVPEGENYSFEYQLFPDLLKRGEKFFAHIPEKTYWLDIGTPARYLQAHHDLLAGTVSNINLKERRGDFDAATASEIDDRSLIADGCTIKPGAQVINSVLGEGVYVDERARVENSVVWSHTRINGGAHVVNAIVGRSCYVGRSSMVGAGAVLGDKTSLTDYTQTGGAQ